MWLCEADSCYHLSTKPNEKKPGSNPVQLRRLNNKWRHLTVSGDIHISNFTASLSILYNWYKTNLNLNSISMSSSQSTGSSSPVSKRTLNLHFHSKYYTNFYYMSISISNHPCLEKI